MMKKIIACISALALSLTALSSMVYAADYEVSLGSGTTSTALEEGIAYISVYGEGVSDAICASGTIAISVPSGTLSTEEGYIMTSEKMGLSKKVGMKTYYPEFQCAVNADGTSGDVMYGAADDGLDTVVVSWGGSYAFAADANDLLCELMVVPTSDKDIDMELVYVRVDIYEDDTLQAKTGYTSGVDTQYVLAAGTSTITAKTTDDDDDTATITQVGEGVFTGENDADDKAVAYTLNIANASGNTVSATSTWTKADSTTETRTLSKAIENIEATNVVLGIIVQFDGDDYSNVEITNMSIN